MSGDDDGDKEHEPSQKKLADARARGEVVQSADLVAASALLGLLAAAAWTGAWSVTRFGATAAGFFAQADRLGDSLTGDDGDPLPAMLWSAVLPLTGFLLFPAGFALAALLAQRAIVFAPDKIMPRLSRINPMATAGHRFGIEGLAEFAKATVKLALVGFLATAFMNSRLDRMLETVAETPGVGMIGLAQIIIEFLVLTLVVMTAFGALDYLWQRHRHIRRNRMSRQEMIDEFRQSEGDPHVKQQRRHRAREIATNRMLADVPRADVVVVNPTHYAVALRWDRKGRRAPVCVAKGVDETAARIRTAAAEAGVPIHADPPTARALHAQVEIGHEIAPEHYRAVAAAIRFAETMRRRARTGLR